jgi:hypothetical protein
MEDDELLTALRAALVENEVVEAGRAAWPWRGVDAELAELAYDSADRPALAGLRSSTVPPRQLTFESGPVRLELEVGPQRILGQVLPPQEVHIQLQVPEGPGQEFDSDGQGRFIVEPTLTGPVRLRCSRSGADPIVTDWVLL